MTISTPSLNSIQTYGRSVFLQICGHLLDFVQILLRWPLLTDLFPWQHSGIECKRIWSIALDEETLRRRWRALMKGPDRAVLFREMPFRRSSSRFVEASRRERRTDEHRLH